MALLARDLDWLLTPPAALLIPTRTAADREKTSDARRQETLEQPDRPPPRAPQTAILYGDDGWSDHCSQVS
jgi:hypothetical protein